jgi:ATP-dependent Clp protease ATP-binding subunit ClpC
MFERYTEQARRVIFFARWEAGDMGAEAIESEHLLLGLWREGSKVCEADDLGAETIDPEPLQEPEHLLLGHWRAGSGVIDDLIGRSDPWPELRARIKEHSPPGKRVATSVDMPLSEEAKRVLAFAAEELERSGGKQVDIGHLLLGLLLEEGCFASGLLRERGADLETIRKRLEKTQGKTTE